MKTLQVCNEVIRPVLDYMTDAAHMALNTEAAVALLLGTCAVESGMGEYIRQYPSGPARGVFQIEVRSFDDLYDGYITKNASLFAAVGAFVSRSPWPLSTQVSGNLYLAAAICRCYYRRVPAALPGGRDPHPYAAYWKKYYNTAEGAGTVDAFVQAWDRHRVGDVLNSTALD